MLANPRGQQSNTTQRAQSTTEAAQCSRFGALMTHKYLEIVGFVSTDELFTSADTPSRNVFRGQSVFVQTLGDVRSSAV